MWGEKKKVGEHSSVKLPELVRMLRSTPYGGQDCNSTNLDGAYTKIVLLPYPDSLGFFSKHALGIGSFKRWYQIKQVTVNTQPKPATSIFYLF